MHWGGIVAFAFVLSIGLMVGAIYFDLQRRQANVRADVAEEARDKALAELAKVTAERDEARAALKTATTDRDDARDTLTKLANERDEARASLVAANLTIAGLEAELRERIPGYVPDHVRTDLAQNAAKKCGGRTIAAAGFQCRVENGWGPVMLAIPSGGFTMGSPVDELGRDPDEWQHSVQIERPFAIGKYEVTFDEYARFARAADRDMPPDEGWGRGRRPVINVSWNDARAYADWLSHHTGQTYRLPTEAEWEYAARAGMTGPFSFDGAISPNKANYDASYTYAGSETGEYRLQTLEVGSFPMHENRWGLNDVHGNCGSW